MLEIFTNSTGTALASGDAFPRRFGMFFWGNGVLPDRWVPTATGADWPLSPQLAPLASVRDVFSVVTNLEVRVPNTHPHGSGPAGLLSGRQLMEQGGGHTFAGPSVDQLVAARLGDATKFRSLEFGAEPESGLSWNGPNSRNPPESSPFALYERIFGPTFREPGETSEPDPSLGLRRSILDAVGEDAASLRRRLGAADQARLEQHMEAIRALELRLVRLEEDPPQLAACSRPGAPPESFPWIAGRPQLRESNRAFADLCAMALACDQTRVFTNFISAPINNLLLADANAGHHQLTHDEPGDQPQVHRIVLYLMEEFAYFLQALRSIPEGDGTLLDQCAILGTTDVSYGRTHSLDEYPLIVAGTAGGRLRTGLHIRTPARDNASRLILSLMRAVGVEAPEFGADNARTDMGLSEIEV
jgi:hypothetical protein